MRKHQIITAMLLALSVNVMAQSISDRLLQEQAKTTKSGMYHFIGLSLGPSFITSKMYYDHNNYSTWRPGVELTADYNCIWSSGLGFGITYAHNMTGYKYGWKTNQDYIGPSFVYRSVNDSKWKWKTQVGLGYGHYGAEGESRNGFAVQSAVGVEYKFSKHIGVGVDLNSISITMKDEEYDYQDEHTGISRLSLNTGIRIYL